LLAIYCREQHNERVTIRRVRELRIKIQNEIRSATNNSFGLGFGKQKSSISYAST
jgi:hypothetical protein